MQPNATTPPILPPVPLPESIYLWILGLVVLATIAAIPIIRKYGEDIETKIREQIDVCCGKSHNANFYLEMFHLSRKYHDLNSQIKYTCWALAGIVFSSMAGFAYQQRWYINDPLYINVTNGILLVSGIFFSINAMQIFWRYIKRR